MNHTFRGLYHPAWAPILLMNKNLWADSTTFYSAAPANYYAKFWHDHALDGKSYGFPYDDVGGYSSYISHTNPEYLLVAVGW